MEMPDKDVLMGKSGGKGQSGLTAERLDPCFSVLLQPADLPPQLKLHCRGERKP